MGAKFSDTTWEHKLITYGRRVVNPRVITEPHSEPKTNESHVNVCPLFIRLQYVQLRVKLNTE